MPVRALLHYALEVPDPAAGETFYRTFGLVDEPARGDAVHLRPAPVARACTLLYPGPKKRLHHLAFGAPGDELEAVRESIRRAGVREVDPPRGAPGGGFWIRDPDGHAVNVRPEAAPPPPADPPLAVNTPGHILREVVRGAPDRGLRPAPRKLGHVLLFTPDVGRQIDFYTRVLGLKLSDRVKGIIAFLRCTTDHHNLALLASAGPGFHHASFQVGSIDEIALGAARMQDAGWTMGWGLGRHVIGSNYFHYTRDPWGSFAEYYHDLDFIPEQCAWTPRDFPEADSLYVWGPPPPPEFVENAELA
jgi:catechol 2,3-dioxygenase-like lactoylglutathione lyase family enzyme